MSITFFRFQCLRADQAALHTKEFYSTTMSEGNQTAPGTMDTQDQFSEKKKGNDTVEEEPDNDDGTSGVTGLKNESENRKERVQQVDVLDKLSGNGVKARVTLEECGNSEKKVANDTLHEVKEHHYYELIGGQYYYSDATTGKRYRYKEKTQEWEEVIEGTEGKSNLQNTSEFTDNERKVVAEGSNLEHTGEHGITIDSEGRTYYYADNQYMCKDNEGNIFYLNEQDEWKPWAEKECSQSSESSKWYFYQGDSTFYRDNISGVVYKYNKEDNKWEKFEGKLKKKRPLFHDDEEFDTEDEG